MWKSVPRHTHRNHLPVVPRAGESVPDQIVDPHHRRLFRRYFGAWLGVSVVRCTRNVPRFIQPGVGTIAIGLVARPLTSTQPGLCALPSGEGQRCERSASMRAIAKRLVLGSSARAPKVFGPLHEICSNRRTGSNVGFGHCRIRCVSRTRSGGGVLSIGTCASRECGATELYAHSPV